MEPNLIVRDRHYPSLQWPKIEWQKEMWLALVPFLLGFIVFFFSELDNNQKLIVGLPLCLAPLWGPLLYWVSMASKISIRRIKLYPKLYSMAQETSHEVNQLRRSYHDLVVRIADNRRFEISKVAFGEDNLVITIVKKRSPAVRRGDEMHVIHDDDGLLMGIFQITKIGADVIYAKGVNNIDAVWSGYIQKQGTIDVIHNLTAIHTPQEN